MSVWFNSWRLSLILALCGVLIVPLSAAAAVFSQGFPTASAVSTGMIVSLNANGTVEPATVSNAGSLFGVAVEDAAIETTAQTQGEVQVATSGRASTLVSDLNGQVKKGDAIAASSVAGIGMKASDDVNQNVVGVAQEDASGDSITQQVTVDGQNREIKIFRVPVAVSASFYTAKTGSLSFLQQAGTTVAGKPISLAKSLVAALVLLVALLSVSVLLYTAIRSGLISIGRNPLSESAVRQELLRVLLIAPLILGSALALIYAILRL